MYYARSSSVPFAKAILESGATTARATFYPTHPRHLVQFREFLVAAGIEGVPESSVFATLRTLPAATILKASKALWDKYEPSVTWPFQPVIDGHNSLSNSSHADTAEAVIPDLPILSWQRGHHLSVPVLTGFNTNEGTVFIPAKANTTAEFRSFFSALIPGFGPSDLDALEALYPDPVTDASSPYKAVPEGMGAQWARLDAAYSHYAYICPVLHTAHFLSTSNPTSSFSKSTHNSYGLRSAIDETATPRPVYLYRYAAAAKWGTANHGDEAPVVAHDMLVISPPTSPSSSAPSSSPSHSPASSSARPGLRRVADAMHAAWVNFVVSPAGDPSPVGGSSWPAFVSPFGGGQGRGEMVVFGRGNDERWTEKGVGRRSADGTPVGLETLTDWELERCRFWWERVELSEGVGKRLDRGRL